MDGSREIDLKRLKEVFENPDKPKATRELAYRSFQNILKQVKDKKLTEMRLRLVRALQAEDAEFAEKMTAEIEGYSRQMGYKV